MMSTTNLPRIQLIPRCFFQSLQVRVAIINMCSPNCRINIVCIYSGYIHTAMEYAVCVLCTLCLCYVYVLRATLSLYPPLNCAKELTQRHWGLTKDLPELNFHFHKHTHTHARRHTHIKLTHTHGTRSCLDNSMYSGKVVCGSTFKDTGYACICFFFWFCFNVLSLFNAHATRSWDYEKRCCTVGLVRGGAR